MEFQARQGPWVRGQSPNNGAAKTGGVAQRVVCGGGRPRLLRLGWACMARARTAGLGWAGPRWIGLDWIGLDGRAGCTRGFASIGEREERAGHAGSRGRVRSGRVRSSAGQQAISSKQAGWLAGWRRAGRFAGRFSGRRRRRVSISMHFNWIDYPLTGGFLSPEP